MTASVRPRRIDVLLGVGYDPDPRVQRETRSLAAAHHEVRILAWDRDGTRRRREADGSVTVERSRIRSSWGRGPVQAFYFARLAITYLLKVRRRRPDVLHAVDLPMLATALLISPFAGRPRIVYDAFEIYAVMVSRRMARPVIAILQWLEMTLPRHADIVIVPGEIRQRYLADRGISSVVVPNWMDPPMTAVDRRRARAELGLPAERFVIGYVGGLQPARDLDALLRHAARTPTDLVVIAGRGEDEARLRSEGGALPNVQFLGWLPDPAALLAALDVLFYALHPDHPYAELAAPNTLYSAIAHAVPLVYRNQGELAILAARHRIGESFSNDDELREAIDRMRDKGTSEAVRTELRDLRNRYSWKQASKRLLQAYARLPRS